MEKKIQLDQDDLLTGEEMYIIITALKHANKKHIQDVKAMEREGKTPLIGRNYLEIKCNHGILWKLRKFVDKEYANEDINLKTGKL